LYARASTMRAPSPERFMSASPPPHLRTVMEPVLDPGAPVTEATCKATCEAAGKAPVAGTGSRSGVPVPHGSGGRLACECAPRAALPPPGSDAARPRAKDTAWRCVPGVPVPVRMFDNDVACLSYNAKDCLWPRGRGSSCEATLRTMDGARVAPLRCGKDHEQLYGRTGYSTPRHWCHTADGALRASVGEPRGM
jgi:hypothetical protein